MLKVDVYEVIKRGFLIWGGSWGTTTSSSRSPTGVLGAIIGVCWSELWVWEWGMGIY